MKKKKPTALETKLDQMAMKLADDSMACSNIQDATSAFKAVTVYYMALNKIKPPVDEDEGKFGGHAEAIRGAGVSGHRRGKAGNGGNIPEF